MIELRKALPDDAKILAMTRQLVWKETYRGIYSDRKLDEYDLAYYCQRDRAYIADPAQHYYLFMDKNVCVGYVSFGRSLYGTYKDFSLCLNNLYICKCYQGRGLGRQAFQLVKQYCINNHIPKFFCGCNVHNIPAQKFYLHMGGVQGDSFIPHEDKADDIIHFEFTIGDIAE